MLPDREGLFNAYPTEIGVAETGPNNLATCTVHFRIVEELLAEQWADCSAENLEITGYFYLEKKDGSLNSVAIEALKAALGWDGRDPFWLQDTDLTQQPVQLKLGFEQYNGQPKIKVQFLNPYGREPTSGVSRADDAARRALNARLGAKLRAAAGGTPAPAPRPSGKPAPPKRPAKAPTQPAGATATMEEAWAEFCAHCTDEKWTDDAISEEWFRIVNEMYPGKQPEQLTPADWAVVKDKAPGMILPF